MQDRTNEPGTKQGDPCVSTTKGDQCKQIDKRSINNFDKGLYTRKQKSYIMEHRPLK